MISHAVDGMIGESIAVKQTILADVSLQETVPLIAGSCIGASRRCCKMMSAGSWESAADSQHFGHVIYESLEDTFFPQHSKPRS